MGATWQRKKSEKKVECSEVGKRRRAKVTELGKDVRGGEVELGKEEEVGLGRPRLLLVLTACPVAWAR